MSDKQQDSSSEDSQKKCFRKPSLRPFFSTSEHKKSVEQEPAEKKRFSLFGRLSIGRKLSTDSNKLLHSDSQDKSVPEGHENICSHLAGVDSCGEDEAVSKTAAELKHFFGASSSAQPEGARNTKEWVPPDSWATMSPVASPRSPCLDVAGNEAATWAIRVFKPPDRTENLVNPQLEHTFVSVSCTSMTTAAELCTALQTKFASTKDLKRFRLFVVHGGTERLMADDDRPVVILKKQLLDIGYEATDNLGKIGREDHSYLCRFIFHEFPPAPPSSSKYTSDSKDSSRTKKITPTSAYLADENLSVFPVAIFNDAATIEFMDLSRNMLLELPDDLFASLTNLRLLRLVGNFYGRVPLAISKIRMLTHLDLSSNDLSSESLLPLASCLALTHLTLACNQIERLPEVLGQLRNVRMLDVSSNYLTCIGTAILAMKDLRELRLAFNDITEIPDEIVYLESLRMLDLLGNCVVSVTGRFHELQNLRQLDLRGNLIEDFSSMSNLQQVVEFGINYNRLQTISECRSASLTQIEACHNPIVGICFGHQLAFLKTINLAVCKISALPENLFEYTPHLEVLALERNRLETIPSSINLLTSLRKLTAYDNMLGRLDLEFATLSQLKSLDVHANNLKMLSAKIWDAPSLVSLCLSSNFIPEFPACPNADSALVHCLERLYLSENQLHDGSFDSIWSLTRLSILNLSYNQIFDLGYDLCKLERLVELYVSGNNITSIPDTIDKLQALRFLFVNGNKLTNIPAELTKITGLCAVDVSCNSLRYNITNIPYDWNW